jgi:WD40 repeat protein
MVSVVGGDPTCRIVTYPDSKILNELKPKSYTVGAVTGHVSRVYGTVFKDENLVATCGWDNMALIWDLRSGDIAKQFYGPKLSGESMAFFRNYLITASSRPDDQLQVFDMRSEKIFKTVTLGDRNEQFLPYTLAISQAGEALAVGGMGDNRIYFLETSQFNVFSKSDKYDAGVNAVCFSRNFFGFGLANSFACVQRFDRV